jgi:hypothetical protein
MNKKSIINKKKYIFQLKNINIENIEKNMELIHHLKIILKYLYILLNLLIYHLIKLKMIVFLFLMNQKNT